MSVLDKRDSEMMAAVSPILDEDERYEYTMPALADQLYAAAAADAGGGDDDEDDDDDGGVDRNSDYRDLASTTLTTRRKR